MDRISLMRLLDMDQGCKRLIVNFKAKVKYCLVPVSSQCSIIGCFANPQKNNRFLSLGDNACTQILSISSGLSLLSSCLPALLMICIHPNREFLGLQSLHFLFLGLYCCSVASVAGLLGAECFAPTLCLCSHSSVLGLTVVSSQQTQLQV